MQTNIKTFTVLFTRVIVFSSLFLYSSCSKDVSPGDTAARTPTELAAALQTTQNVSVPYSFIAFIECANNGLGEEVQFSGDLHILIHVTENDNRFTVKSHFQPMGIKGVGAVTGDVYSATGVTQDTQSGSFINGSFTYNFVNNYKLIGPGPGNNFLAHENYTITINANGTVVTERDNFSFECK